MNQFKSFHRVSVTTPAGTIVMGQNVPDVSYDGKLSQGTVQALLYHVTGCIERDAIVSDIKLEELPLEGDYLLRSPTDFMTDEGIAFALANIFNWKDPRNGAPIFHQPGEGLFIKNDVNILNLDNAFQPFDPINDLALCMTIMQMFKVELRYAERTGEAYFRGRAGCNNKFVTPEEIRREICRTAIDCRFPHIQDSGWDGTVHLSMVSFPPTTIADMAPGQQENVSILQDPPMPSDAYAAQHRPDHVLDPLLVDEPKE